MLSSIRSKILLLSRKIRFYGLILLSLILLVYSILFLPIFIYFLYKFRHKIKWKILFIILLIFIISFAIFITLKFIPFKKGIYKIVYIKEYQLTSYVVVKKGIFKYFFYTSSKFRYGQIIKLDAKIIPNLKYNPLNSIGLYDFIFSHNIISEIKPTSIKIIKDSKNSYIFKYLNLFDESVKNYLNIIFKNYGGSKLENNLKAINIFHILSFSSFHLIIIEKFISKMLFFTNIKRSIQRIIILLFFMVFLLLFGRSFILIKFIIFIIIDIIFDYFDIYIEKIDKIFLSFIIISIMFPQYIFSLSYKIVYLFTIIFYFISPRLNKYNSLVKNILIYYIFQIITIPLISQYINSFSIFLIFITPIFIIYFKYFFIPFLYLTFLIYPLESITKNIIFLQDSIFDFIYTKNFTFPIPKFNIFFIFFYYLTLLFIIFYKYRLNLIKNIIMLATIFLINQFKYYLNPIPSAYFFNVGQGNFSLVRTGFGTSTTVVDFFGDAKKRLDELGVFKIDTLILTHNDKDHIGNIKDYNNIIKIDTLILNNTDNYPKLNAKKTIRLNDDYKLIKNNLEHTFMKVKNKDFIKNNNSVVVKIKISNKTILFTGDIEKPAEKLYFEKYRKKLKCDILMVPHHGSSTSSTTDFVISSDPMYAIISCGYLNRFNFPSPITVEKYKKIRAEVLKTHERKYYKFNFIFNKIYIPYT